MFQLTKQIYNPQIMELIRDLEVDLKSVNAKFNPYLGSRTTHGKIISSREMLPF